MPCSNVCHSSVVNLESGLSLGPQWDLESFVFLFSIDSLYINIHKILMIINQFTHQSQSKAVCRLWHSDRPTGAAPLGRSIGCGQIYILKSGSGLPGYQ